MRTFRWILPVIMVAALLQAVPAAAQDSGAVHDPITKDPVQSDLGLVLKKYAQLPQSTPTPTPTDQRLVRRNRINYIGQIPDGSGRMYVPDLNGRLYVIDHGVQHTYMDLSQLFAPRFFSGKGMGQGFGFVAFDPDFRHNGRFYTVHTEDASKTTATPAWQQPGTLYHGIITEWTATDPAADTFSGTHREVLRLGYGGQIHGIQQISFNPTSKPGDADYGDLYVASGEGGLGHADNEPQDLSNPFGKLLRIDPRGHDGKNGQYGVPKDNPFVGRAGTLGEIYAYGFRDPHRFTWDPLTHRLFLGHIGEHAVESVDDVRPGDNFGWSQREGLWRFDQTATDPCDRLYPLPAGDHGYTYPVAAYDHDPPANWNCTSDVGVGISGGVVYRRHDLPDLYGKYIFGDIVDGRVMYTDVSDMRPGGARNVDELATIHKMMIYDEAGRRVKITDLTGPGSLGDPNRVDLRFSTDEAGHLYLIAKANGTIWRVVDTVRFASCDVGSTRVTNAMSASDWAPKTPSKWRFPGDQVILAQAGDEPSGPRRPYEYAVLKKGPAWKSVQIDAEVRLDTPVEITNRDVILLFGFNDDLHYSYAHLSTSNDIYPHNGIFTVNNADRLREDDQWDAYRSRGAPPAITDAAWHKVRVKHCGDTGETAVYVDGAKQPLITAVDTTFPSGRVGFGSFDNIGRIRDLTVTGTPE